MGNLLSKKISITASLVLFFLATLFLMPRFVQAAVRCETQYGGGQVCVTTGQLQVNKKVWDLGTSSFVDNLVATGVHHFVAGETVTFTVRIQNVGDAILDNVMFTDTLPSFLTLSSGNVSENLGSLAPGQAVDRTIKAVVINGDQLPTSPSTVCDGRTTNAAEARSGDTSDRDTAEICVDNKVKGVVTPTPVITIPQTGPEMLVYPLLVSMGGLGLILRKKLVLRGGE